MSESHTSEKDKENDQEKSLLRMTLAVLAVNFASNIYLNTAEKQNNPVGSKQQEK